MLRTIISSSFAGTLLLVGCRTTPNVATETSAPQEHTPTWLTNGLTAFFPFNGNANDASGHGYNGTPHNVTAVPDHLSNPDSAYRLNGADAYISFGPVLPDMQTVTVTAWVNSSGGGTFFADADWEIANDFTINLGTSDTVVRCDKSPAPEDARYTIPLDTRLDGVWRNIVWVVKTNSIQVYVDGESKGAADIEWAGNIGYHDLIIGTQEFPKGNFGWGRYWKGEVSNLRIYNRALSADEVRQLYAYESRPSAHANEPKNVTPKNTPANSGSSKSSRSARTSFQPKVPLRKRPSIAWLTRGGSLCRFLTVVKTPLFLCLRDTNDGLAYNPARNENKARR